MKLTTLTRRTLPTARAAPSVHVAYAGNDAPGGTRVLARHANTAPRWLDLQRHYRGATPDHFLNVVHVVHDALIPRLLGTAKVSGAGWIVTAKISSGRRARRVSGSKTRRPD